MNKLCLLLGASFAPLLPLHAAEPAATSARAPGYESAFQDYRAHREEPLADWRALNDEVGRIGGHVGIMRQDGAKAGAPAGAPRDAALHPATSGTPRDGAPPPAAHGHRH